MQDLFICYQEKKQSCIFYLHLIIYVHHFISNCPNDKKNRNIKEKTINYPVTHPVINHSHLLLLWPWLCENTDRCMCKEKNLRLEARNLSFWPEWLLYIKAKLLMKPVILYQKGITRSLTEIELDHKTSKLSSGDNKCVCVHNVDLFFI